ncbi:hypothetical protein E2C01_015824 [Portunus trituberculatus]|uniref:Uncharacterized protein n=1 Tax=Portunus trituberculatus TaxID=210409 RepID=A0A5B7DNX5_PORTR|nr:hypothetical protein [Portunus trituberculatus]
MQVSVQSRRGPARTCILSLSSYSVKPRPHGRAVFVGHEGFARVRSVSAGKPSNCLLPAPLEGSG